MHAIENSQKKSSQNRNDAQQYYELLLLSLHNYINCHYFKRLNQQINDSHLVVVFFSYKMLT